MIRFLSAFLVAASVAQAQAVDLPPPTGDSIVAPDAKLELLFTRSAAIEGGLTEGAACAPDGSIYFSDIPVGTDKGMILRFDPATKQVTTFTADSRKSNGLIFDAGGRLLACEGANYGGRSVARWNVATKQRTVLADNYKGKRFNAPNDLCIDREGRIFFSDPRYLGTETRELEHRAVYRLDPNGKVTEVTHAVSKPNGVALSPDDRTLYVAEHNNGTDRIDPAAPAPKQGLMRIHAFPLDIVGNVAGPGHIVLDFGDKKGCDGMTVDLAGRIYLTVRDASRPGVLVIDKEGKEQGFIPTGPANQTAKEPVGLPSNVEFGLGADEHMLYITVDKSLYRIRLKSKGFHRQFVSM